MNTQLIPGPQENVDPYQGPVVFDHNLPIEVKVRRLVYYCVTEDQLDDFADMGLLVTLFLTFFGLAAGTAITCWVTFRQGALSAEDSATFVALMWASIALGGILLGCAALFYYRQRKQKKKWITKT